VPGVIRVAVVPVNTGLAVPNFDATKARRVRLRRQDHARMGDSVGKFVQVDIVT
jgi:hypothetical protein